MRLSSTIQTRFRGREKVGETDGCVREGEHLSPVEGFVGGVVVVEKTHVDEVNKQTGSILGRVSIIGCPLVEDQQDEVAKQA